MYCVSHLASRNELGDYLNELGLTGKGVEIGTHQGDYAVQILSRWKGEKLYCVDPYERAPEYEDQVEKLPCGLGRDRKEDAILCKQNLTPYKGRVGILRMTSIEAMTLFDDDSLDFVYLDGNHTQRYVEMDLVGWLPKLRPGGLLAGHDIVCHGSPDGEHNWGREIQPAVMNRLGGMVIYLIVEGGKLPWSYYTFRR